MEALEAMVEALKAELNIKGGEVRGLKRKWALVSKDEKTRIKETIREERKKAIEEKERDDEEARKREEEEEEEKEVLEEEEEEKNIFDKYEKKSHEIECRHCRTTGWWEDIADDIADDEYGCCADCDEEKDQPPQSEDDGNDADELAEDEEPTEVVEKEVNGVDYLYDEADGIWYDRETETEIPDPT